MKKSAIQLFGLTNYDGDLTERGFNFSQNVKPTQINLEDLPFLDFMYFFRYTKKQIEEIVDLMNYIFSKFSYNIQLQIGNDSLGYTYCYVRVPESHKYPIYEISDVYGMDEILDKGLPEVSDQLIKPTKQSYSLEEIDFKNPYFSKEEKKIVDDLTSNHSGFLFFGREQEGGNLISNSCSLNSDRPVVNPYYRNKKKTHLTQIKQDEIMGHIQYLYFCGYTIDQVINIQFLFYYLYFGLNTEVDSNYRIYGEYWDLSEERMPTEIF